MDARVQDEFVRANLSSASRSMLAGRSLVESNLYSVRLSCFPASIHITVRLSRWMTSW